MADERNHISYYWSEGYRQAREEDWNDPCGDGLEFGDINI